MWNTPAKSGRATTVISTPRINQYDDLQEAEYPECIIKNSQYQNLYNKIHRSNEKVTEFQRFEKSQEREKGIKNKIMNDIQQRKREAEFQKKFQLINKPHFRGLFTNKIAREIGYTSLQLDKQDLIEYFSDSKRAFDIDEKARLTQFFLRDIAKGKQKETDYIDKVPLSNRYRRLFTIKNSKQERQIYHDKREYQKLKRTVYIKNDQFTEQIVQRAKTRPAYLRKKNFQRKQYIVGKLNHTLITKRNIEYNPTKQERYNILKKCFMWLAECSEAHRRYYSEIDPNKYEKIHIFLFKNEEGQVTKEQVKQIIDEIIKNKNRKVIQFYDFWEFIEQLQEKYDYNSQVQLRQSLEEALAKQNNPNLLIYPKIQSFKAHNQPQIRTHLINHKLQTSLMVIYRTNQDIINDKFLPIHTLIEMMKKQAIVPELVQMNKLLGSCYWYERRNEGFTIQQLKQILLTLAFLIEMDLNNLPKYIKKFIGLGTIKK